MDITKTIENFGGFVARIAEILRKIFDALKKAIDGLNKKEEE